jgi:prolyl-tRNA synthetase
MYAKWIKSYRDLPVLINLWNSVVRWEMRTKLFLRTTEFYWQEGHTAHATAEEANEETLQMLRIYADFAENDAAVPVIMGRKSQREKFAGAQQSYSIEAMMGDKRALQAGTSHYMGDNFAKAFEIRYLDRENELQYCHTTSWGLSTRFIGAIIMVHGDDKGLVLPPKIAPYQIVVVPIHRNEEEQATVMDFVDQVAESLHDFRVHIDRREGLTPGFKFNDWEMRGVPVRLEIGPKDVQSNQVVIARRDRPGKEGKHSVGLSGLSDALQDTLADIQHNMHVRAAAFRDENIHQTDDYEEFKKIVEGAWADVWWCNDPECEAEIKTDTKATNRCVPLDQPGGEGKCIRCGDPAHERGLFARAY